MKSIFHTKVILPLVATVVLLIFSILGVKAQSGNTHEKVVFHKTLTYNFNNTCNLFKLNGVGKVIVKHSNSNRIHCQVDIYGIGKVMEVAQENASKVKVTAVGSSTETPMLEVVMRHGRYDSKNCKVETTVYLPSTVSFEHNENITIMDMVSRLIEKIKR